QIFNPFQQVENEYNRRFDGLGLGLAISQNLASALQGRLFVESEQAKGSTFYLCLPTNHA
ncbi:MAG: ATP-binding protein, partial [Anaerolineae bacterium]